MHTDFIKILSDLARKYQETPEGEEKDRLKKVIDKAADFICGKITIEDISNESGDPNVG